jgi:hypothetical protein
METSPSMHHRSRGASAVASSDARRSSGMRSALGAPTPLTLTAQLMRLAPVGAPARATTPAAGGVSIHHQEREPAS